MKVYNIQEAKTHLSRLVEATANGEEVLIAKHGKPMARLTSYSGQKELRRLGGLEEVIRIPDDFDAEDPEITARFSGSE